MSRFIKVLFGMALVIEEIQIHLVAPSMKVFLKYILLKINVFSSEIFLNKNHKNIFFDYLIFYSIE